MTKNTRKLILARNDLIEKVAEITSKEGRTLFSFTNEIFEQAIVAFNMDTSLAEVLQFYKMMSVGKNSRHIVVPFDIFSYLVSSLYLTNKLELLEKCYECGLWTGNYLRVKFSKKEPLEVLQDFMKATVWDLDEFSISTDAGKNSIKCFSSNLTFECTQILTKYLEGILHSLDYETKIITCLRGIIKIELGVKQEKFQITEKFVKTEA